MPNLTLTCHEMDNSALLFYFQEAGFDLQYNLSIYWPKQAMQTVLKLNPSLLEIKPTSTQRFIKRGLKPLPPPPPPHIIFLPVFG